MIPAHEEYAAPPENDFELLMPDSVNQSLPTEYRSMILRMIRQFMVVIQLGWLVLFSFFVIRAGEDTERKLINLLIIVGSAVLGAAAALVIEYLIDSRGELALSIGIISANIGCAIAGTWNYWRSGGIYKGKKGRGSNSDKTVV